MFQQHLICLHLSLKNNEEKIFMLIHAVGENTVFAYHSHTAYVALYAFSQIRHSCSGSVITQPFV